MNRQEFEKRNARAWTDLDLKLNVLESGNKKVADAEKIPSLYRKVTRDLSLAQYRMFGEKLCDRLNHLAIRSHRVLSAQRGAFGESVIRFTLTTFPQAIRRERKLFLISSLLFWVPFFLMWFSARYEITWVQALLGSEQLANIEGMYGEEETIEHLRQQFGSNFEMFAHYINNNVGIDFRLFAGGIFFGLGTIFFLVYNGLAIGGVVGYVEYAGDPQKLWSFVAGHSSFELLGMIVVGMAGLKLGIGMLSPGQSGWGASLTKAGKEGLPLLIGGSCMTALAAVVEGFWSAQPMPSETKYAVGITFWVLHVLYFTFVGRGRSEA